jgi:hypothetical protein
MPHRLAIALVSATALALASCGGSFTPAVRLAEANGPPTNLTYSENPATYPVGIPITPNTPSTSGGAAEFYAVLPALPPGLALNPTTGVITGTIAAASARASYSVIATNTGGITATAVSIGTDPQQVTVTVMQSGGPDSGSPVVESSGINDGTSPPSPTGVIETRSTDDVGKATFTVPSSTPTGKLCFSSLPTSGISFAFTSRCMPLNALEPTVQLFHF